MVFDLKAMTDAAMCAIFDPVALAHLLELSWYDIDKMTGCDEGIVDQNQDAGNLITHSIASDGSFTFRFYVDEDPPEEAIDEPVSSFSGALLKVPSGKLCAVGYEYLPQKESRIATIDDYDTDDMGESHAIPPGNYRVDGYNLAWQYDVEESRSITEVFKDLFGRGKPKPVEPYAIFVLRRLPDDSDISKLKGAGLSL